MSLLSTNLNSVMNQVVKTVNGKNPSGAGTPGTDSTSTNSPGVPPGSMTITMDIPTSTPVPPEVLADPTVVAAQAKVDAAQAKVDALSPICVDTNAKLVVAYDNAAIALMKSPSTYINGIRVMNPSPTAIAANKKLDEAKAADTLARSNLSQAQAELDAATIARDAAIRTSWNKFKGTPEPAAPATTGITGMATTGTLAAAIKAKTKSAL